MLSSVWKILNHKVFFVVFFVFLGSVYGTKTDRYFGWTNAKARMGEPILSDGAGYYCHLPQWFIYKTNNFEFLDTIAKTYPKFRFTENVYVVGQQDRPSNKYFTGSAVAMVPFFTIAHLYATHSNGVYPADGYSHPYLLLVSIACVFYFLLGCLGIYFLLRKFSIDRFWIIACLLILGLGTNIGYYTYIYTPYSHIFSFAAIAWLLYIAKCWADRHSLKRFLLFCALFGMTAIIRPTNMMLLVFIPFLFPSTREFLLRLRSLLTVFKWQLLAGLLVFGSFIYFQLWNVHMQTGKWELNTYNTETFEFLGSPKIMEVLFSFRKGFFIFAPVMLLMVPGWIVLFRENRRIFWGSVLFFTLFTYITASWWCWWYGGGLGMRPFIDVFPVLIIPIAFLFQYTKIWAKCIFVVIAATGCWMGQVYEYQMKHNILHYDDMTYEQFKNVFMSKGLRYSWGMHLQYEHLPAGKPVSAKQLEFSMYGKPMPENRYLKLFGDNFSDNPILTIISQPSDSLFHFGAKIKGEVFLYSEDTNPAFFVKYYNNGELYRENPFFIGQFIPEVEKLQPFEIELYPDQQYHQFDSVKIEFAENNTFTGVKNFNIAQLRY